MKKGERRHQGSGHEQRQRKRQKTVMRTHVSDYKQVIILGGKVVVGGVSYLLHCRIPPIVQLVC